MVYTKIVLETFTTATEFHLMNLFSGSNIQIIKDKTGAFVYVDKENVSAQYAGRCIIRGNSVQVQAAEKRVVGEYTFCLTILRGVKFINWSAEHDCMAGCSG